VIGDNCNISQGVTIGEANRGPRKGTPVIGNNVYIGPGAKIIGAVHIGNNVAVGANCVVTRDVPDGAVVVGVPGRVISYEGSKGYIIRTDYDTQAEST
jgi:serine O-acetyltransferase